MGQTGSREQLVGLVVAGGILVLWSRIKHRSPELGAWSLSLGPSGESQYICFKLIEFWQDLPSLHGKYKGRTWKHWQILFLGGSKITVNNDCSLEIKRCLLLDRKAMTNLDSVFKNRDITLPTKVSIVKAMVFPVVMYACEGWIIKKAEHWRIDAFELGCWRIFLRGPWTARRPNQSTLKEINPECSLERLMLKLKLQYFGHLIRRADSLEKTLMLGKVEGRRRLVQQRMRWLDNITDSIAFNLSKLWETVKDGGACCAAVHGVAKIQTQLSNWTTTTNDELEACRALLLVTLIFCTEINYIMFTVLSKKNEPLAKEMVLYGELWV